MWSNTDKVKVKKKDVINTDKGQLGRCDQIQMKVN